MRRFATLLQRLALCQRASMTVEIAVLAPVLVTMSIGAFEIGSMVARQTELQTATAEAAAIVRASTPTTAQERLTIRSILAASAKLSDNSVSVVEIYRCDDDANYVTNRDLCGVGDVVNTFIRLSLATTYTPLWTKFGISTPMSFNVVRTIQVG